MYSYKIMLIIKKKQLYYPIYYLNPLIYFRTKLITTKLYEYKKSQEMAGHIHDTLKKAIEFEEINKHSKNPNSIKPDIILSTVISFVSSIHNKQYKITAYFVDDNNKCYYIEITKLNKQFYFPVKTSSYTASSDIKLIHECYTTKKYKTSFEMLNLFIKAFNNWIALESEARGYVIEDAKKQLPIEQRVNPIYNFIKIDKWLMLLNPWDKKSQKEKNIIGFKYNDINYYHEEISKDTALKLHNNGKKNDMLNFDQLLYHPDEINMVITNKSKSAQDDRTKNISRNIYDYYIYELLLLEFTEFFNKEKNEEVRLAIKKEILKSVDTNIIDTTNNITDIIIKYFNKYPGEADSSKIEDITRIVNQINEYIIKHHDKKLLINKIDSAFYNFDKVKINHLKTLDRETIVKELSKIAQRIINTVPESEINKLLNNSEEFPNMIISCQNKLVKNNIYCKQNKLVISTKKLDELINIMASDVLNPFKQKWLFNVIFTDQILKYFKFIRNPHETITINVQ